MVWFRETGKGEAFSWLDPSSSTEWWTFDLLVCQKLHQQTNSRDLSPAETAWISNDWEQSGDWADFLFDKVVSCTLLLWKAPAGVSGAVCAENISSEVQQGPGEALLPLLDCELPFEPCLVWMQTPSLHFQISLCWHLCSCFLSCPFSGIYKVIREASGKGSRCVTERSQPLQTAKSLPQVLTRNVGSNLFLHTLRPFTRLL